MAEEVQLSGERGAGAVMWTTVSPRLHLLPILHLPFFLFLLLRLFLVFSTAQGRASPPGPWWSTSSEGGVVSQPVWPRPPEGGVVSHSLWSHPPEGGVVSQPVWLRPLSTLPHFDSYPSFVTHHHHHQAAFGSASDLGDYDDLVSPGDLVSADNPDLMGADSSVDSMDTGDIVIPGDLLSSGRVVSSGDVVSTRSMVSTEERFRQNDVLFPGDIVSPEDFLDSGDLVIPGDLVRSEDLASTSDLENPGRTKRKVISSGGHYIVWSRSGTSPWSSTSYESVVGDYKINHHREYGWNPRGQIGDGGSRKTYPPQREPARDRRNPRKKLSKSFKREIAQYAMVYGTQNAALHYEKTIGRRLRDRVVNKFVQRYQERRKRRRRRRRRLGQT
ncbi:uncharacterized protein [Procambarus clarkii]|uniref:uncharacterized protein n=1 Tax=Procambarus clarkii TaxID=6728 RepID=UPI0037432900